MPSQIGQLKSLVSLDLSYNSLSGAIPSRLGELRQLQKLYVSSNNLTAGIPDAVANLTSFTFLALSNNSRSGQSDGVDPATARRSGSTNSLLQS